MLIRESFWFGAGYRTGDAVIGMMEYLFVNGIRVGYSYDFTTSTLKSFSSGSHEVMVGYEFYPKKTGKRNQIYCPKF